MKNRLFFLFIAFLSVFFSIKAETIKTSFSDGTITIKPVARNAVRVQYAEGNVQNTLPEWIYVRNDEVDDCNLKVSVEKKRQCLKIKDARGKVVFVATRHQMQNGKATLVFSSPKDESLFGLGQFQDGYSNVRGLSRRLTQVNTQISLPMLLSSKGYGILWNNCGMTEYNPSDQFVKLTKGNDGGVREEVDVTSTEGGKREVREHNFFEAVIDVAEAGDYSLLLDVGQKMARRHNLVIDGQTVIDMQNMWLPPTASQIVHLEAGKHKLRAELTRNDTPVVYYHKVKDETVFSSPVATSVDYTVFVGSADEIIASYRHLTGDSPLIPSWALGYIHCRERFHSSDEILQTANRFRQEGMPLSMIVQIAFAKKECHSA